MFRIENLLDLFEDERTKEIIANSYFFSQSQNKDLSDNVFKKLLYIKNIHPNFNILIDTTIEKACFNANENIIYLNSVSISTFFHELTHALSYYFSQFQVPDEYYAFKNNFIMSNDNMSLMQKLLNLCKEKKQQLMSAMNGKNIDNNINNSYSSTPDFQNEQYEIISTIEDIVDSIYDGQSFSYGLAYAKDDKHIYIKSNKASGHGCEYYLKNGYQFEELLADYQTIKLTFPNNQLFILLKEILGNEFVSFLEQRCQKISSEFFTDKDLNINHYKK